MFLTQFTYDANDQAEGLGNDNRETVKKVKTTGKILPFKNGTALPSPSPAPGYPNLIMISNNSLSHEPKLN